MRVLQPGTDANELPGFTSAGLWSQVAPEHLPGAPSFKAKQALNVQAAFQSLFGLEMGWKRRASSLCAPTPVFAPCPRDPSRFGCLTSGTVPLGPPREQILVGGWRIWEFLSRERT